jgi:hypothetical protein
LVVTSAQNGFSQYYPEILRAEGLNEFSVLDVAQVDRAPLKRYGVVLLGELSRANLILLLQANNMPLPRFWYLPRGAKAAIVMTGDDHGGGGRFGRLQSYLARDPPHCSADDWQCINATAYIFDGSIPAKRAATLIDEGFEIGLHLSTDCKNWTSSGGGEPARGGLDAIYQQQLAAFVAAYPRLPRYARTASHGVITTRSRR